MTPRFSLRSALVAITVLALLFGWYARSTATRANELRKIDAIERLTRGGVTIVEDVSTIGRRGTWNGAMVRVRDCGPRLLRPLQLDLTKRVIAVEFNNETNVDLLAQLQAFRELESLSFNYQSTYITVHPLKRSPESAELIGALRLYTALYPDVEVDYPDKDAL